MFGVAVLTVGRMVMTWMWCLIEASKITLSVERVWLLQWAKECEWEVLTQVGWDECTPWQPVIVLGWEGITRAMLHRKLERKSARNPKWWLNQQHICNNIHIIAYKTVHRQLCKLNNIHCYSNQNSPTIITTYAWKCVASYYINKCKSLSYNTPCKPASPNSETS